MHIPIDPAASEPIYEQIRAGIAEAIVAGRLAPGEALPSIRSLARDLRVSVITTTRAYNELVSDGLVVPQQGRGVFVRDQPTGALQERARTRIMGALDDAVRTARIAGIGAAELHRMLDATLCADADARPDRAAGAGPRSATDQETP